MVAGSDPTRVSTPDSAVPNPGVPVSHGLQFLEMIGKGGFGAVYRATDDRLGRVVAAKVLLDHSTGRERFLAEAMITGNLQHPHIIPVHSLAVDERGRDYFTMPVVQGRGLDDVIRGLIARDPATIAEYSLPRLISILVAVGDAVSYAHARGVVHRDLKPQNIMLGKFGEVFVLDWGIAKLMGRPSTEARKVIDHAGEHRPIQAIGVDTVPTLSGTIIGTPGYMSPEQARGETDTVGFPADVYALGVVLFQLLSLGLPVDMTTAQTALLDTVEGRIRDVRAVAKHRQVPRALAAIASRAVALQASQRYPDAASLVSDLRAWLEDREVLACPDGPLARSLRWIRRHRTSTALIGGILASTVVAAVVLLSLTSHHNSERARLADIARVEAERAATIERMARELLERHATAVREYLPGIGLLERAEWNEVWAGRAVAAFDRALAIDPDFAEAHRARASALHLANRDHEALAAYERALELSHAALGRDDPELLRKIGDVWWMSLLDFRNASSWYQRAAAADPANPHARIAKAILRSMDGDNPGAISEMRTLVAEAPDLWEAHQSLGMLLLGAKPNVGLDMSGGPNGVVDPKAAVAAFNEAIRLRPGYARLYAYRGMARTMQYFHGDHQQELLDGCLADYDLAVLLAPEWLNGHVLRLQSNFFMHHSTAVQQEVEALRQRWPKDPTALLAREPVEVQAGHGQALLKEVEAALAETPDSTALRDLRDDLHAQHGSDPLPQTPPHKP
jgi:serine/threonine protein kinase/tetratricopeptide (TPR) repeat protein